MDEILNPPTSKHAKHSALRQFHGDGNIPGRTQFPVAIFNGDGSLDGAIEPIVLTWSSSTKERVPDHANNLLKSHFKRPHTHRSIRHRVRSGGSLVF